MRIKGVIRRDLFSPMTGWIFFLLLLSSPLSFSRIPTDIGERPLRAPLIDPRPTFVHARGTQRWIKYFHPSLDRLLSNSRAKAEIDGTAERESVTFDFHGDHSKERRVKFRRRFFS